MKGDDSHQPNSVNRREAVQTGDTLKNSLCHITLLSDCWCAGTIYSFICDYEELLSVQETVPSFLWWSETISEDTAVYIQLLLTPESDYIISRINT